VEYLISLGCNLSANDVHGNAPLHLAAREGHLLVVKLLVEKGADLEAQDSLGVTALHLAAKNNHIQVPIS